MERKAWNNPQLESLDIAQTMQGKGITDTDVVSYDADGNPDDFDIYTPGLS